MSRLFLHLIWLGIGSGLATGSALTAGPTQLSVDSRTPIYSVEDQTGAPNNQVHFPFMHVARDGRWYLTHREGPHGWGVRQFGRKDPLVDSLVADDRVQTVMSGDQGRTWRPWPGLKDPDFPKSVRLFRTRLRNGVLLSPGFVFEELTAEGAGASAGYFILRTSTDDGATWQKSRHFISGLPFAFHDRTAPTLAGWGPIVVMDGHRLLVTVYGNSSTGLEADLYHGYKLGFLESPDEGKTWRFGGWIADDTSLGNEGANEASLARVGPNRLVAVFRSGSQGNSPLYLSHSHDGGRTWIRPRSTGILRGVSPQLLFLPNQTLIMSYGTRGDEGPATWVRASRDGGETWETPLSLYRGSGTGYTDLEALSANKFQVVYDESVFRPGSSVARNQIVRYVLTAN